MNWSLLFTILACRFWNNKDQSHSHTCVFSLIRLVVCWCGVSTWARRSGYSTLRDNFFADVAKSFEILQPTSQNCPAIQIDLVLCSFDGCFHQLAINQPIRALQAGFRRGASFSSQQHSWKIATVERQQADEMDETENTSTFSGLNFKTCENESTAFLSNIKTATPEGWNRQKEDLMWMYTKAAVQVVKSTYRHNTYSKNQHIFLKNINSP